MVPLYSKVYRGSRTLGRPIMVNTRSPTTSDVSKPLLQSPGQVRRSPLPPIYRAIDRSLV